MLRISPVALPLRSTPRQAKLFSFAGGRESHCFHPLKVRYRLHFIAQLVRRPRTNAERRTRRFHQLHCARAATATFSAAAASPLFRQWLGSRSSSSSACQAQAIGYPWFSRRGGAMLCEHGRRAERGCFPLVPFLGSIPSSSAKPLFLKLAAQLRLPPSSLAQGESCGCGMIAVVNSSGEFMHALKSFLRSRAPSKCSAKPASVPRAGSAPTRFLSLFRRLSLTTATLVRRASSDTLEYA